MRNFLVLIIVFLRFNNAFGQTHVVSIIDFGAAPNDQKSDQLAFNAAAKYINKRKGFTKLIIPTGSYLVGPIYNYNQKIKSISRGRLWDVLNLENCDSVVIEGGKDARIKFNSGIPVGTVPGLSQNTDSAVHVGAFIRLTNSKNITVKNLHANGNNSQFRLLKTWGAGTNPYEREHDGLFLLNCQNIQVLNSSFNYFVRDGVMILQDKDKMPVKNITIINSKFNNNGRNGLSWCGGENVNFANCQFNFNATGKIVTNPACGIDIEPERGAKCRNGSFTDCLIEGNGGYALGSGYAEASNVTFKNCKFIGSSNYSIFCQSPAFVFKDCTIAGTSMFTYNSYNRANGTQLINCKIVDSIADKKIFKENYLLAVKGRYVSFSGCDFKTYSVPIVYTEISKKSGKKDGENTLFENCIFTANFKKKSTWGNLALLTSNSKFKNCKFYSTGLADFNSNLKSSEKNIEIENTPSVNSMENVL